MNETMVIMVSAATGQRSNAHSRSKAPPKPKKPRMWRTISGPISIAVVATMTATTPPSVTASASSLTRQTDRVSATS